MFLEGNKLWNIFPVYVVTQVLWILYFLWSPWTVQGFNSIAYSDKRSHIRHTDWQILWSTNNCVLVGDSSNTQQLMCSLLPISISFTSLCKLMTLLILFKTCNLQLTLSQLIPKSYPLDLWVIHFLLHVLYKELNHHLTLSQMIPKSCPTGSLVDSFLNTLRTQFIMWL